MSHLSPSHQSYQKESNRATNQQQQQKLFSFSPTSQSTNPDSVKTMKQDEQRFFQEKSPHQMMMMGSPFSHHTPGKSSSSIQSVIEEDARELFAVQSPPHLSEQILQNQRNQIQHQQLAQPYTILPARLRNSQLVVSNTTTKNTNSNSLHQQRNVKMQAQSRSNASKVFDSQGSSSNNRKTTKEQSKNSSGRNLKYSSHQKQLKGQEESLQSIESKDIADEFDYKYDPAYTNERSQSRGKSTNPRSLSRDKGSKMSGNRLAYDYDPKQMTNGNFSDKSDLIHATCKQLSHMPMAEAESHYFVQRMEQDVEKRGVRERTLNAIKYSSPPRHESGNSNNNNFNSQQQPSSYSGQGTLARSGGAERSQSYNRMGGRSSPRAQSPSIESYSNNPFMVQKQAEVSRFSPQKTPGYMKPSQRNAEAAKKREEAMLSSSEKQIGFNKKKLNPQECINIYNRLVSYDHKKKQAVEMLKEAKRFEEEQSIIAHINSKKRGTEQQQAMACERLARDAEMRKVNQKKKKEATLIEEEEKMKALFKPVINSNIPVQRESIFTKGSTTAIVHPGMNLKELTSKIEQYQQDAQVRAMAKSGSTFSPKVVGNKFFDKAENGPSLKSSHLTQQTSR